MPVADHDQQRDAIGTEQHGLFALDVADHMAHGRRARGAARGHEFAPPHHGWTADVVVDGLGADVERRVRPADLCIEPHDFVRHGVQRDEPHAAYRIPLAGELDELATRAGGQSPERGLRG